MPIDLLEQIRLNNLFGPSPIGNANKFEQQTFNIPRVDSPSPRTMSSMPSIMEDSVVTEQNTPPIDREQEIIKMINSLYKPDTRYTDMYAKTIQERPEREQSSLTRKLIASGLGLLTGDANLSTAIAFPKYATGMPAWEDKVKNLEPLMREERAANTNNRQLATTTASSIQASRRQDEAERKNKEAEAAKAKEFTLKEKDAESRRIRAVAYDYATRHRDSKFEQTEDGRLIAIDPRTNKAEFVLDPETGKAIKTGDLGDEQKAGITLANAKTMEAVRQGNRVALEGTRQANRVELISERAKVRKASHDEDKRLSVSQDAAAWKLARQQYIADNPTHALFWDDDGPTDDAADDDTGTYERAVDGIRDRYNRIKGKATPSSSKAPTTPTTAPKPTTPTATVAGEVGIYDKTGKRVGNIKDTPAQRAAAIKAGYTVR